MVCELELRFEDFQTLHAGEIVVVDVVSAHVIDEIFIFCERFVANFTLYAIDVHSFMILKSSSVLADFSAFLTCCLLQMKLILISV